MAEIEQEPVGKDNVQGGGEFPDADTPPDREAGAPGPEMVGHREHGKGQLNDDQPPVGGPDGDPAT